MKNQDTAFVYVAKFDDAVEVRSVQPAIRNEAIERCSDKLTKLQRYCVWRLLDYALTRHFGKGVADFHFEVDSNGKWSSSEVCFSLTHCNHAVAVAVCSEPVGVDIEAVSSFVNKACDDKFVLRVLAASEIAQLNVTPQAQSARLLTEIWTQKESLFKLSGGKTFVPGCIDTAASTTHCQFLQLDGADYALSVATPSNIAVQVQVVDVSF